MMLKSLAGITCTISSCIAIMLVPLTIFNIISNCAPFWTAILSYFFLGENIHCYNMIAMGASFIGVIMVTLADPGENNVIVEGWSEKKSYLLGISASLIGSISYAVWFLLSRPLKDVHFTVIACWQSFSDTIFTGIFLLFWTAGNNENRPFSFNSSWAYLDIVGIALVAIPASYAMI